MTIPELSTQLQAHKGDWPSIAKRANVAYVTVLRIAHGRTKKPSHLTFDAISKALRK